MYVISDIGNQGYWRSLRSQKSDPMTMSNLQIHPAAGDYAEINDHSDESKYSFMLKVTSSESILAGSHFSFDLAIAPDAIQGTQFWFGMSSFSEGDIMYINVVPEPVSILLFGFGGLALLKTRKK